MITSHLDVDLSDENSIASILGFEYKVLIGMVMHESTNPVNIMKIRIISVDCNIVSGAYINGTKAHTLFDFDIDVEPEFKLTKEA